jgi:Ca-activated chloride channel family protein
VELSALAIDTTGSMAQSDFAPTRLAGAQEAAVAFIRRKRILDGRDRTAVVAFDTAAWLVSPFGRHPFEAQGDVQRLSANGGTNITAGLRECLDLLIAEAKNTPGATLRCVLLTDGEHNTGADPIADGIVDALRRARVSVDTVSIGNGESLLMEIAKRTGGTFVRCGDFASLLRQYEQLAAKVSTR